MARSASLRTPNSSSACNMRRRSPRVVRRVWLIPHAVRCVLFAALSSNPRINRNVFFPARKSPPFCLPVLEGSPKASRSRRVLEGEAGVLAKRTDAVAVLFARTRDRSAYAQCAGQQHRRLLADDRCVFSRSDIIAALKFLISSCCPSHTSNVYLLVDSPTRPGASP